MLVRKLVVRRHDGIYIILEQENVQFVDSYVKNLDT